MSSINLDFQRKRFEESKSYYSQAKVGLTPEFSKLHVEVPLVSATGSYNIDIKKAIVAAQERVLSRNDLFIPTHLFVGTRLVNSARPSAAPMLTYALPYGALPTGVAGYKTQDINSLYNSGKIVMRTGSTVFNSGFPLDIFKSVPQTQPSRTPYIASTTDTNPVAGTPAAIANTVAFGVNNQVPEFDLLSSAFPLAERFAFAGTKEHKIAVEFDSVSGDDYSAADNTGSAVANTTPYLSVIFLGYLIVNGAEPAHKVDSNPFSAFI